MPKKKNGYLVKIRDNSGHQQSFYSPDAPSHAHGNSLAATLIEHFSQANPGMRFETTEVVPSNGEIDAIDIKWSRIDRLVW